ncbi:MAG: hypothetical protein KGL93_09860 [Gemmatimonadota bacterium]|nr:hypothetical protein [Gemmatimonadota bacterium]
MRKLLLAGAAALLTSVPMAAVLAQSGNCSNCTGVNVTGSTVTGGAFLPVSGIGARNKIINTADRESGLDPLVSGVLGREGYEDPAAAQSLRASLGAAFSDGASNQYVVALVAALENVGNLDFDVNTGEFTAGPATMNALITAYNNVVLNTNSVSLFSNQHFLAIQRAVLSLKANWTVKSS